MSGNGQTAAGVRVAVRGTGTASVDTGLPVLDRLLSRLVEVAGFDLLLEIEPGDAEAEVVAAGNALGEALAGPLRAGEPVRTGKHPAVVGQVAEGRLLLDLLAVQPWQDDALAAAVLAVGSA